MTTPTNDRQTSERERTHGENCYLWDRHHYECALREIERLRAENEALRSVTPDDVEGFLTVLAEQDCQGVEHIHYAEILTALQSFIRSKESHRG